MWRCGDRPQNSLGRSVRLCGPRKHTHHTGSDPWGILSSGMSSHWGAQPGPRFPGKCVQWDISVPLKTSFFLDPFFEAISSPNTPGSGGVNYSESCFEKILVFCSPNLMASREEPGVGSRLTQLNAGVCDLGKSLARGSKGGPVQEVRRGGVGRDPRWG